MRTTVKLVCTLLCLTIALPTIATDEVVAIVSGGWFAADAREVKDTTLEGGAIVGGETNVVLQSSANAWGENGGGTSATITWSSTSGKSGTIALETTADLVDWLPEAQFGTNTLTYVSGTVLKTAKFCVVTSDQVVDPIPDLGKKPTIAAVKLAVGGSADTQLTKYVTNDVQYAAYRAWATKVLSSSGGFAGTKAVYNSRRTWISYALDSPVLLTRAPEKGEMKVASFEKNAKTGEFDFSLKIDGITVGEKATAANLATLFNVEGCSSVEGAYSSDNLTFTFGTPVDGKVMISATPADTMATQFFIKAKMAP